MMGWTSRRGAWLAAWLIATPGACVLAAAGQMVGRAAGQAAAGRGAETLDQRIAAILAPDAVARDHWGIQVTTLDGTVLYSLNGGQLFQPASNVKLFTTAAALALLGPNQRFTTRVEYGAANDKRKIIDGDVVIIGGGDSNLTVQRSDHPAGEAPTNRSPSEGDAEVVAVHAPLDSLAEFADEIAANGVKRIKGNVVGDDTVLPWEPYPQDWAMDDGVWGYGAPVSGLSVNDNELQLTVTPGRLAGEPPALAWQAGMPTYYSVDATGLTTGAAGSGSHVQMEREGGSKTLRVYGSIAVDAVPDAEQIAIADPAEFAAIALKELLEARGIGVAGVAKAKHRKITQGVGFVEESNKPLPELPHGAMSGSMSSLLSGTVTYSDGGPVVLQLSSPTVQEDVPRTNKMSENLHAELLLRHLGKIYGQTYAGGDGGIDGSTAEGARVVRQFLINAGIDGKDFVFFDGSGLSGHDLVTPRATAQLLSFAAHDAKTGEPQPWFAAWKASLPVGGVDGTLAGRFAEAPLKGHVFAKTGTLGEARALSGYLDAASGRTIIFSIFVGDHLPNTTDDREAIDRIVAAIQAAE